MKNKIPVLSRLSRKIREGSQSNDKMPCKDFTPDDVVAICCDIARFDNIKVQSLRKKSIFRRISSENDVPSTERKTSVIARRLSLVNGIPCADSKVKPDGNPESPRIEKKEQRKFSVDSSLARMQSYRDKPKEHVPGLRGRDIVAVAILVDDKGTPIRTYTEDQDIPQHEIEAAGKIFMSRIPVSNNHRDLSVASNNNDIIPSVDSTNNDVNTKALEEVLSDLDIGKRQRLVKKLDRSLAKLHTTDLNTATSFLKTDRFADARREIKAELLAFVGKDLKMAHVT